MKQINFSLILGSIIPDSIRISAWIPQFVELLASFLQGVFTEYHAKIVGYSQFAETPTYTYSVTRYLRKVLNNSSILIANYQVYIPMVLFQKAENQGTTLYQKSEGIGIATLQASETQQPYNFVISAFGSNPEQIQIVTAPFVIAGTKYKII